MYFIVLGVFMDIYSQNIIQSEREKLNQMIDNTLTRHIPLSQNEDVQKQTRFLEQLIEQANKDKENR
jgi:hypothetical protein